MPAAARGTSIKAAKAFVRFFVSSVDYAMASGDTDLLLALSAAECASCRAVAENIAGVYSAGGKLKGKGWRIAALSQVRNQPSSKPIIQAAIFVSPQSKLAAAGATPQRRTGGRMAMIFFLHRRQGDWKVTKWDRAA